MGCLVEMWKEAFRHPLPRRADKVAFRVNAGLVAFAVALLPVAAWWLLCRSGVLSWAAWGVFTLVCLGIVCWLIRSLRKLRPMGAAGCRRRAVPLCRVFCLALHRRRCQQSGDEEHCPDARHQGAGRTSFLLQRARPLAHRAGLCGPPKIRPLNVGREEDVLQHLPCAVLTHKRVGEELPQTLWNRVDTLYVGRFDDNRRPATNPRYSDVFVYHVTLLKPKQ